MAFLGGSIGASEWVMLFVVVLVVVGPKRLPEVARKFGKTMEMFRRAADEFKEQLLSMDKEVKDTVGDAVDDIDLSVEGDEGPDDSYEYDEGAYDNSDYPGNEDLVSEWDSESGSGSEEGSDNLETPDQVDSAEVSSDNLETPDQVVSTEESSDVVESAPEEPSDDPARGETGSAEEKA